VPSKEAYAKDPEKYKERQQRWRAEHPETPEQAIARRARSKAFYQKRAKYWHLERKYGLTKEAYEAKLLAQDKRCAICSTLEPGGKGDFHVDHDHETDRVRGLLCQMCNMGLGSFGEDITLLERAVRYLKNEHD
jgi:hypothetical protein